MAFTISMPSLRTAGSRGANLAGLPTCSGGADGCVMQQLRDGTLDTTDVPRWASTWARAFGFRLTRFTSDLPSHQRLIGMSGREIVQARLQRFMSDPVRAGESMVVMRIDIDDLERVNEALSLEAGDLVLEAVAERIIGVIGNPDNVARISGSAFIAIVPEIADFGEDAELAHKIRRAVADPVLARGHVIQPTVSIGVAYADTATDAEQVLQNATLAVRRAKDFGGDRVAFAADDLANKAMERLELEEALRIALATDEIRAWYQPIVDFVDGKIVGYEALSRWITSDGCHVSPVTFIPLAESTGLIPEIDYLVLSQSLALLAKLPDDQFIAVNVSPASLTRPDFVGLASALLKTVDFDLRRLHLEVTETSLPSDLDVVRSAMLELGMGGAQWYFDDFGTGYSSLSHLGELPVDGLKLDMSFTRGIHAGDETSLRLAHGLLALAKGLNLDTVAEGVESAEVAEILREQGWACGQGWLYGKAEPHAFA